MTNDKFDIECFDNIKKLIDHKDKKIDISTILNQISMELALWKRKSKWF